MVVCKACYILVLQPLPLLKLIPSPSPSPGHLRFYFVSLPPMKSQCFLQFLSLCRVSSDSSAYQNLSAVPLIAVEWMGHIPLSCSSLGLSLGCSHILACCCESIPRSGIAGLCDSSVFTFVFRTPHCSNLKAPFSSVLNVGYFLLYSCPNRGGSEVVLKEGILSCISLMFTVMLSIFSVD